MPCLLREPHGYNWLRDSVQCGARNIVKSSTPSTLAIRLRGEQYVRRSSTSAGWRYNGMGWYLSCRLGATQHQSNKVVSKLSARVSPYLRRLHIPVEDNGFSAESQRTLPTTQTLDAAVAQPQVCSLNKGVDPRTVEHEAGHHNDVNGKGVRLRTPRVRSHPRHDMRRKPFLTTLEALHLPPDSPSFDLAAVQNARAEERAQILLRFGDATRKGLPIPSEDQWDGLREVLYTLQLRSRNIHSAYATEIKHLRQGSQTPPTDFLRSLLEYSGKPVPLPQSDLQDRRAEQWWSNSPQADEKIIELEREIWSFARWTRPTSEEAAARSYVSDLALKVIREVCPDARAQVFGSQGSGLALANSDIDIRLELSEHFHGPSLVGDQRGEPAATETNGAHLPARNSQRAISQTDDTLVESPSDTDDGSKPTVRSSRRAKVLPPALLDALKDHDELENAKKIPGRRPVLQVTHVASRLTVQIVQVDDVEDPALHMVRNVLAKNRHIGPVYQVLKASLDRRGLLQPFTGGLSSYGLFNAILACMRCRSTMAQAAFRPQLWSRQLEDTIAIKAPNFQDAQVEASRINPRSFFPSFWPHFVHRSGMKEYSSCAYLLLDVLYFFSHFDHYGKGISALGGYVFRKKIIGTREISDTEDRSSHLTSDLIGNWEQREPKIAVSSSREHSHALKVGFIPYHLHLIDAADSRNDLGSRAINWKHTRATLFSLWTSLAGHLGLGTGPPFKIGMTLSEFRKSLVHREQIHEPLKEDDITHMAMSAVRQEQSQAKFESRRIALGILTNFKDKARAPQPPALHPDSTTDVMKKQAAPEESKVERREDEDTSPDAPSLGLKGQGRDGKDAGEAEAASSHRAALNLSAPFLRDLLGRADIDLGLARIEQRIFGASVLGLRIPSRELLRARLTRPADLPSPAAAPESPRIRYTRSSSRESLIRKVAQHRTSRLDDDDGDPAPTATATEQQRSRQGRPPPSRSGREGAAPVARTR